MTMRKSRFAAAAVALGCVGAAVADVGPIPPATIIMGTAMCQVDGWEYAPRWSIPDSAFVSPSVEACAADCEADMNCSGATWIVDVTSENCWFKNWGTGPVAPPCKPAADAKLAYIAIIRAADCAAITYMDTTHYSCDVEAEIEEKPALAPGLGPAAMAPEAIASTTTDVADLKALNPPYDAYPGVDYSATQMPAPALTIADIGKGMLVADAVECATACSAEPTCNAASYYGDNPSTAWPSGSNCYLKNLMGCALPDDVLQTADATIFMIGGAVCSGAPVAAIPASATGLGVAAPLGAAPPLAETPLAAPVEPTLGFPPVPGGVPPLVTDDVATDDVGTNESTRSFGAPAPSELGEETVGTAPPAVATPSGSMGALPGFAAAASALAAAALLV